MTAETGSKVIINGWKASSIYDVLKMGSSSLPSIDPFHDISPLVEADDGAERPLTEEMRYHFVNEIEVNNDDENEEEEWKHEDDIDFNRNAFDFMFDDEE